MALQFPGEFPRDGLVRRAIEWSTLGLCYPDAALLIDDTNTRAVVCGMRGHLPDLPSTAYKRAVTRGALIRMVPALLCHQGNWKEDFVTQLQTLMPEPTEDSTLTAASMMYALWLATELNEVDRPWDQAAELLCTLGPRAGIARQSIEAALEPASPLDENTDAPSPLGILHAAREALISTRSYADAVAHAISVQNQGTLLGAVVGGVAGVRFGMYGIPTVWRDTLRGKHQIEHALSTLFDSQTSLGMV